MGTFTVTIDGDRLGGFEETTATLQVQVIGRDFVKDPAANLVHFAHVSAREPSSVSLPHVLPLYTDAAAGGADSTTVAYRISVRTQYGDGGMVEINAKADGAAVHFADLVSDWAGSPVPEDIAVRAETAADEAQAAAASLNAGTLVRKIAPPDGLNDTAILQAAINDIKAYAVTDPPLARPVVIDGRGGVYRITDGLDLTGIVLGRGWEIRNMSIHAACAGDVALDLTGSRFGRLSNVRVWGDQTSQPHTGLVLASGTSQATDPCSHFTFDNVTVDGYFTSSALHLNAAEENNFRRCMFWNRRVADAGNDSLAAILDGAGFKTLPVGPLGRNAARASFTVNKFDSCSFQKPFGIAGPTMFMQDMASVSFESCYLTAGAGSAIAWRLTDGFTPYRVYMDFQLETTGVDRFIEFTANTAGAREIRGLHCTFGNMYADQEVFSASDVNITALTLRSFRAHLYRMAAGVSLANKLFSGESKVSIHGGDIVVPTAADFDTGFATLTDVKALGMDGTVSEYGAGALGYARKTADQTVNNSVALVADTALTLPVVANAVYEVSGQVLYSTTTTADMQAQFAAPAGAALEWAYSGYGSTATGSPSSVNLARLTLGNIITPGGIGTGSRIGFRPLGILTTGGTAGSLTLTWAQGVAEVSDTVVHAGSFLKLTRIS